MSYMRDADGNRLDEASIVDTIATLPATYVRIDQLSKPLGSDVVWLGDSIVLGGEVPQVSPVSGQSGSLGGSWPALTAARSGGKIRHVRNSGITGNTSVDMLARFDADVAAYNPTHVHISAGVNDSNTPLSDADYTANMIELVRRSRAIGATVTMQTITPVTSAGTLQRARISRWNDWILTWAPAHGIPVVDFHSVCVNPTNGDFTSALTGDGTHPNDDCKKLLAEAYLTVVDPLLPARPPRISRANTDTLNLLTNGMFIGDTDVDGIANSWANLGATPSGGSFSRSVVADPAVLGGSVQRLTVTGTTSGNLTVHQYVQPGGTPKYTPGDRLRGTVLVKVSGGVTAQLQLAPFTTGYVNVGFITRYISKTGGATGPDRAVLEIEFTVPPTGTHGVEFICQIVGAGTGTADFSNATLRNLTVEGVV